MHSDLTRRRFLHALARAAASAGVLGSYSLHGQSAGSESLIVHSNRPVDRETPASRLTSWITPNERFFIRSHFYTPEVREAAWRLSVDGDVERPLQLTLADLKAMPATTGVVTLECAGNGRGLFQPPVAGIQWKKGAVGTARWRGVRLAEVLRRAGLRTSAQHVWLDGADVGVGRAPDFVRNLPIGKALHPDTLLAWEMNGEPLPIEHGFPVRAIVPGWEGAYSVKWLTHIQASAREHDGFFVQTAYRYPKRPVVPGGTVAAADTAALSGLPVKSIITSPGDAAVATGLMPITGFAWVGEGEIARVEVSTDRGETWSPARLGTDRAPWAWRQFTYEWRVTEPGTYVVLSRATDTQGRTQPLVAEWNPAGYLWNAVDQQRVTVEAR
jgi:DMSO/TMAO reductase YedYZ molybdopterin-dependent catalytic subunit